MKFSVLEFLKKNSLKICNDAKKSSNNNCFQNTSCGICNGFSKLFFSIPSISFFWLNNFTINTHSTQLYIWLLLALT